MNIDDDVPPALGQAATNVVRYVMGNDLKSFRACCSKDGMIVVERSWDPDYKASAGTLNLKQPHSNGMVPLDWVEQEEDIQPGEVTGYEFSRIFKQFHAIIVESYGGFDVSTSERDAWNKRFLGPAVSVKWAAGAYLYFYLVKERHGWKVWRMEVATH